MKRVYIDGAKTILKNGEPRLRAWAKKLHSVGFMLRSFRLMSKKKQVKTLAQALKRFADNLTQKHG